MSCDCCCCCVGAGVGAESGVSAAEASMVLCRFTGPLEVVPGGGGLCGNLERRCVGLDAGRGVGWGPAAICVRAALVGAGVCARVGPRVGLRVGLPSGRETATRLASLEAEPARSDGVAAKAPTRRAAVEPTVAEPLIHTQAPGPDSSKKNSTDVRLCDVMSRNPDGGPVTLTKSPATCTRTMSTPQAA